MHDIIRRFLLRFQDVLDNRIRNLLSFLVCLVLFLNLFILYHFLVILDLLLMQIQSLNIILLLLNLLSRYIVWYGIRSFDYWSLKGILRT